ncbi:MAG: OmpA family protein [Gammaproteobacteria bacterium]|nr:OmpA family protein [Gammaproteobacteria bacterium]
MNRQITTGLALSLCVALTGCANSNIKPAEVFCPVIGAITGAGIVAGAANTSDAGALAGGAALGAAAGYMFCHERETPPAPAPAPAPPKAPPPPPPPPPPPEPEIGTKIMSLEGTNFAFNSAALTDAGKVRLDDAARLLIEHGALVVEVAGHTDSVGSLAYNQKLSERRAKSVAVYLESKGVDPAHLAPVVGYGKTKPVATNDTAEGRAQNRRVELIVTDNYKGPLND